MIQHWVSEKYTDHQFFGIGGWGLIETYISAPTVTGEPEIEEIFSGGYFDYEVYRPRRFKAKDEEEKKAKPILEDIAEQYTRTVDTQADMELILRLRLRQQGLIYKSLYMRWLNQQAKLKRQAIKEKRLAIKKKRQKEEEEIIMLYLH